MLADTCGTNAFFSPDVEPTVRHVLGQRASSQGPATGSRVEAVMDRADPTGRRRREFTLLALRLSENDALPAGRRKQATIHGCYYH